MRTNTPFSILKNLMILCLAMLISAQGIAQTIYTWTGASSGAWLTTGNWSPAKVPGSLASNTTNDTVAYFNNITNLIAGINMNTQAGKHYLGALRFGTSASSARTVNNSSTTVAGVLYLNGVTLNSIANTIIWNSSSATHVITNGTSAGLMGVALNNPTDNVIQITGAGGITITSLIQGSGQLTKEGAGAGVLALATGNTYTGKTFLNAGTVSGSAETMFGAAPGSFVADHLTFNGGTLSSSAAFTFSSNRGITLGASGGTINTTGGAITLTSVVTGSGAITKTGTGTLNFSGLHTYTGSTSISQGTLATTINNAIPSGTAVILLGVASTALDIGSTTQSIGSVAGGNTTGGDIKASVGGSLTVGSDNTSTTFGGNFTGTGAGTRLFTKVGTGTLTVTTGTGTKPWSIAISAGTLKFNTANVTFDTLFLNGGTFSTVGISMNRSIIFARLSLTDNSTIALAPATTTHTIDFNTLGTMTAGKMLTITGWEGVYNSGTNAGAYGRISIGTSAFMTSAQLAQIRFFDGTNYYAATQLTTGEIVPTLSLVVTNPGNQNATIGFTVTVTSQDLDGNARNINGNTGITLSTNGAAGTIGGTTTGSISGGSSSVTISGVTLSSGGTGATITATRSSGERPIAGTSGTFNVNANSISTTAAPTFGPFCNGYTNPLSLSYTSVGTFTGNFAVQYSNASGVFPSDATSNIMGTGTTAGSGTINATLPSGLSSGLFYRVRVVNPTPLVFASGTNGSNITIYQSNTPTVSIAASPTGAICSGTSVTFTPTPTFGGTPTYVWYRNGINVGSSSTYTSSTLANGDTIFAAMTSTFTCAFPTIVISNTIPMSVDIAPNQATNLVFGSATASTITLNSFTAPSPAPSGYVVVMNTSNSFTNLVNGSNPTASTTYTSGEQVVYNGTSISPITVSGLSASTTYWFKVYAYNCSGRIYQNGTASNNPLSSATAIANSIATTAASYGPFCSATSNNLVVNYTMSGTFSGAYAVQRSDSVGVFPSDTASNFLSTISSGAGTITATLPSGLGAGNYRVRVINLWPNYFTSGDNGSDIVINTTPTVPTCSTPSAICEGTTATITGSGSTGATAYTYWTAATGGSAITSITSPAGTVASNNLTTLSSAIGGSYIYYVQAENGSCLSATRQAVTVTINALPATPSTPVAAANPSCGATTLGILTPTGGETWFWQGTNATGTSTGSNSSSAYAVSSSNTYYLRAQNNSSLCWSALSSSIAVTINTVPTVPSCSTPASICEGTTATITGAGSTGATAYTYWTAASAGSSITSLTSPAGTVASNNMTTLGSAIGGSYIYYVQGENGSCLSSSRQAVTVTINALPASPSTPVAAANPSCGATTLGILTPTSGDTWFWQGTTAVGTSTTSNSSGVYAVPSTNTYYLRARNNTSLCWSSASTNLAVTINTAITIGTPPSNQAVTMPATASFSVSSVTGTIAGYQWQLNTGSGWNNIGGATSASYTTGATTTLMSGYQYRCIVQATAPCTDVTSAPATLTVNPSICITETFDAGTTVPSGWGGTSANDAVASHYSSAPNCRGLGNGATISTPQINYPASISFYVDASGSGGQIGTLAYTIGSSGIFTTVGTFTATTAGAVVSFNTPSISSAANVSFRITSGGNTIYIDNMTVYCGTPCSSPTVQASAFTSSSITTTTATVGWTRGNGDSVIVVARAVSAVSIDPISGASFSANSAFGSGADLGASNFVVYKGTGTSVNLTGLTSGVTYHFAIYEFTSASTCYNLTKLIGNLTTTVILPDIALSSPSPAVPAGAIVQGTNDNVIYRFDLAVTSNDAILNGVTVSMAGTYSAANITNIKCWYSSDATFSTSSDTLLSTLSSPGAAGLKVMPSFTSKTLYMGTTGYIYITATIPCSASNANNISVSAMTTARFTVVSGNKTGTANNGGVQSISSAAPNNVTAPLTSLCQNSGTTLSWTAPTACSSNVLVFVKAGSFGSGTPNGNGGSYTANTVFGSGTAFDGGFCIYKGTGTTVDVTGLTNGTNYTYKIFTRNDTLWSSGATTNCTPVINYCVATTTNSGFEFIDRVIFNTIDNNSSGDGQYQNWTSLSTTVEKGLTYSLSIYNGNAAYLTDRTKVYIDYNGNGLFSDAGEALGTVSGFGPYTYSVTIPATAVTGSTRMRIRLEDSSFTTANECGTASYGEVEDYTVNIIPQCVPTASITSFIPTQGSDSAIITIRGTGFSSTTGVKFNGSSSISYTVLSDTVIIAEVPRNASTGKISVLDASSCAAKSTADFTFLNQSGTCTSVASDLIISEVFDAETGNTHYIELYNNTGASINLNSPDYRLYLSTSGEIDITGTIANGATMVVFAGTNGDSKATSSVNFGAGFNADDYIRLKKAGAVIDEVRTPSFIGFTMIRNPAVTSPVSIYDASQWAITNHSSSVSGATIGSHTMNSPNIPVITVDPIDVSACSFTMLVNATGTGLTYQWKYNDQSTMSGWSNVNLTNLQATNSFNSGVSVTGATSNTLTISGNITYLYNYQFYCEVTSSGTCTKSSNSAQFVYNTKPVYRSVAAVSGNWTTVSNWEMALTSLGPWSSACTYPTDVNSTEVIVQNGTKIILDIDNTVDKVTIDPSGELELSPTTKLTILNRNTGADLIVNGTLTDRGSSGNGIKLEDNTGTANDASWTLGTAGTIVKTNTSSVVNYRDFYEGGISTIPATANWYYVYNGDGAPITNAVGMYYPNLFFENRFNASNYSWSSSLLSLVGASNFCRVKGNLSIGAAGIGTCTVINNNINSSPMLVSGNLVIGLGSIFTNASYDGTTDTSHGDGTGIEVKGNLLIDGSVTYNNGAGVIRLSGTTLQLISSSTAGLLETYNVVLDNNSDASLSGLNLNVYNSFTFTNGKMISDVSTNDMVYIRNQSTAAIIGALTSGGSRYVEGKLRWKVDGTSTYTFPIGHSTQNAQGFTITATGTPGSDLQGYLEANTTAPIQLTAYCDLERHAAASGVTAIGTGLSGTDGILDSVGFNQSSPLQWDVTNPGGGITSYDLTVLANGGQDITPITSVNGMAIRYLMKNGAPGNPGVPTGTAPPSFYGTGFLACPTGYALVGLTSFSKFTLNGANSASTALPVTLTYFGVEKVEQTSLLRWTTSTEINNDQFVIERSADGVTFVSIGAVKGQGNSSVQHTYRFTDYSPLSGINYYRLKQLDFDGHYKYSDVRAVAFGYDSNINVLVYPNPSENKFSVDFGELNENAIYTVTDVLGNKVIQGNYSTSSGNKVIELNLDQYPSGNYILNITGGTLNKQIKLLKN